MNVLKRRKTLRIFLIVVITGIFSLGFLLFLAPVYTKILNIGNTVGMCICGLLALCTVFIGPVSKFFHYVLKFTLGKIIVLILCLIVIFLIALACFFSIKMVSAANNKPDKLTTVIVLGCKVRGYTPSSMLTTRTLSCVDYLNEYPDACVIVSGGQGSDEMISEAECMKNILVNAGIDPQRIYMEDKSTSTRENIEFSKRIIEDNNLCTDVTICTSEFHHYRTSIIARECGVENNYAFCSYTMQYLLPTYWIREWFGICYELLF